MDFPSMIERLDLLRAVADRRTDEIVVMTMTATLQWPLVSNHDLDFDFLAFGMGHGADFGLGLALSRPERKTIVLKGDGGLLMSLGSLATIGRFGPPNLLVLLLENRIYEMTGGQGLPTGVDFEAMARACGIHDGGSQVDELGDLGCPEFPVVTTTLLRLIEDARVEFGPEEGRRDLGCSWDLDVGVDVDGLDERLSRRRFSPLRSEFLEPFFSHRGPPSAICACYI